VISSLVANLATAYFQLRALDSELEISKRTLASRQESLKLTRFLESHGSNSGLDVSQGRAARLHRIRNDPRPRAANPATGERAQRSARRESPIHSPRTRADRTARPPERSGRPSLGICWSADRTSAKQSRSWSQPTRRSALQKPHSFPTCR